MALNLNKDLKQFYSIAEVGEIFNVPTSLLRYWEKEFPTIRPKKSGNNVRMYTKDGLFHGDIELSVYDTEDVETIIQNLKSIDGVEEVTRIS